jgi:hypothetical protein
LLSYTQAPDAINPATVTDALRPGNYALAGPSVAAIVDVLKINSTMFQLTLDAPLITGSYTITVSNVQASGAGLNAPTSLLFQAYAALPLESIQQGATNDDNPLRRWLPPQYRYKTAWEALIAALDYADTYVRENAYNAFDQLFLSSAIRPYLFQRAADYGIQYPSQVGMSDNLFRKLAIKSTAKKLVHQALLEILEVFYGEDSTRAVVMAGLNEPYNLRTGDTISFLFDDRKTVTVTFNAEDFSNIGEATSGEVAAVMTRVFTTAGLAAYASAASNSPGYVVKVYSGALGLLGSVQVTGGMAQNSLQFPTRLPLFNVFPAPAPQWSAQRVSQDEFRFTWTRSYIPGNIMDVKIGDYVLLDFVNAGSLRGSYEVIDVHFDVNPSTGDPNGLTWFSIAPSAVFPYVMRDPAITINQTSLNEIVFYGNIRQMVIQNINPSYIAQYAGSGVDVIFPATTQAVNRGLADAAYPHVASTVGTSITTISRSTNIATVTTLTPHGLVAGLSTVMIDGVVGTTAGRWNVTALVLTTPGPSIFTIASPGISGAGTGGTVTPMTSPDNDEVPGPYIFDPDAGIAIAATQTTSNQVIESLRGISTLKVTSTAGFPSSGYLVLGFGTKYEIGPVKYVAILDTGTFVIDRTFAFPQDVPSGVNVSLLYQNSPWVPANVTEVGAFWLTDSSSGRVAAQVSIENATAAGAQVTNRIIYPGDRGIGGEGNPITGIYLSDKVTVWAGDGVDQEEAAAHNVQ